MRARECGGANTYNRTEIRNEEIRNEEGRMKREEGRLTMRERPHVGLEYGR